MSHVTRHPVEELLRGLFVQPLAHSGEPRARQIRVDVTEQDTAYVVHADIPGAKREDIHVDIEGNQVSITSEVRREKDAKDGERVLRLERVRGQLSRSFQFEHEIDESQAKAAFQDGVLELTLPKKVGAGGKRLTVN